MMSEISAQQGGNEHASGTFHIHPPLLAAALLVIGLSLHLSGRPTEAAFPFHQLLGLLLVATGCAISSYAAALFTVHNTTRNPYGEPAAFVTLPPYTFTRNPMYVSLTIVLFGFAIFFASAIMLLAPIVFAAVIDRMVIPQEEQTLARIYGEHYREYENRVPRWLPLPAFLPFRAL